MLAAIFAVLLLGQNVASELYVGQNPQNVNAVVPDESGNAILVSGVVDEITILDLNFGDNATNTTPGMSVDITVTPLNETYSNNPGNAPDFEYDSEEPDFGTALDDNYWKEPDSISDLGESAFEPHKETGFGIPSTVANNSNWFAPATKLNSLAPASNFNLSAPATNFNSSALAKNFNSSAPVTNFSLSAPANISNFFDPGFSYGTNKSDTSAIESMPKDPFGPDDFNEVPYVAPSIPTNIANTSAPSAPSNSNETNVSNTTIPFLPNIAGITSPVGAPERFSNSPVIPFPAGTFAGTSSIPSPPLGFPSVVPKPTASSKTSPLQTSARGSPLANQKKPLQNLFSNLLNKKSPEKKPANSVSPFGAFLELAGEVGPPIDPNSTVPIAEQVAKNLDPHSDFLAYESPQNLDNDYDDVEEAPFSGMPAFGNSNPSDMMDPLRYVSQILPPATGDSTNITDHSDATSFLINSLLKSFNPNSSPLNWLGGRPGVTNFASLFPNPMNNLPSAEILDETEPAEQELSDLFGPDVDFLKTPSTPAPSFGGMSNLFAPFGGFPDKASHSMNWPNNSNPFGNLLSSFLGSGMLGSSRVSGSLSNIVQSMLGALSSNITSFMAEVFEVPSGLNGTNSWNFTGLLLPMSDNNATMSSMSEILSSIFGQPFSFNASTPWKTDDKTFPMFGFSFNYGNDTFNGTNPLNFTLLDPSGPLSPMISSFMNSSFSNVSSLMSDMNKVFMGNMTSSMSSAISMISSLMNISDTFAKNIQNTNSKQMNNTMNQIYKGMAAVKKSLQTMMNNFNSPKPDMLPSALRKTRQSFGVAPNRFSDFQTLPQPENSFSSNDMQSSAPDSELLELDIFYYVDESPEQDKNSTLMSGSFNTIADTLKISNETSASGDKTAEFSSAGIPVSSIWLLLIGVVAIFGQKRFTS